MADTITTDLDDTAYVLVMNSASVADAVIQNVGSTPIRFAFGTTPPVVGTTNFHVLRAGAEGSSFVVSGNTPSGNMYARAENSLPARISVS